MNHKCKCAVEHGKGAQSARDYFSHLPLPLRIRCTYCYRNKRTFKTQKTSAQHLFYIEIWRMKRHTINYYEPSKIIILLKQLWQHAPKEGGADIVVIEKENENMPK